MKLITILIIIGGSVLLIFLLIWIFGKTIDPNDEWFWKD